MAYQDLDKIINVGSGTTPGIGGEDDSYNFPQSYKMIAFNVAPYDNNGEQSVQKWIPALDPDYYSIGDSLNNNYQVSTVSGTGVLNILSKTYTFDKNVVKINNGQIKYSCYLNSSLYPNDYSNPLWSGNIKGPYSLISFDETNKKIFNTIGTSGLVSGGYKYRYLINNNGNYYLIVLNGNVIYSYSSNEFGEIIDTNPINTYTLSAPTGSYDINRSSYIINTNVDNNIFISTFNISYNTGGSSNNSFSDVEIKQGGYIISINNGFFSVISENDNIITEYSGGGATPLDYFYFYNRLGTYRKGNKVYNVIIGYAYNYDSVSDRRAINYVSVLASEVDLTNMTTITINKLGTNFNAISCPLTSMASGYISIFVDNNDDLYFNGYSLFNGGYGDGYLNRWYKASLDLSSIVDLGYQDIIYEKIPKYPNYSLDTNITFSNSTINILGENVNGTIATDDYYVIMQNEDLTLNNEDDYKYMFLACTSQENDINERSVNVMLYVNGNALNNIDLLLYSSQTGNRINTNGPTITYNFYQTVDNILLDNINADYLKFELHIDNPDVLDIKLGFGLTGGDYDNPTGTNDVSGSSTTGWDVGVDGMYLDLELEAE